MLRKETVVIMAKEPYSQHLIFFVMYELGVYAGVFHYPRLKNLPGKNTLAFWAHLKFATKIKHGEYSTGAIFITLNFLRNL